MRMHTDTLALSVLGLEEISNSLPRGVTHAVSLVDPGQPLPATLNVLEPSRRLVVYAHDALDAVDGRCPPTYGDAEALCRFAKEIDFRSPVHLLVHCHMGRSRSSTAASIMLLQLGGFTPREVLDRVREVRDPIWPNATLLAHGDRLLGLQGELITACAEVYRAVTDKYPQWVDDPRPESMLASPVLSDFSE